MSFLKKIESKNLDVKERSLSIIHLALVNFSKSLKVKQTNDNIIVTTEDGLEFTIEVTIKN